MLRKNSPTLPASLVLLFGGLAWPAYATAFNLNIPAVTMIPKDNAPTLNSTQDLLDPDGESGVYVAPVDLAAGEHICRLELWARDFDADQEITARLKRRQVSAAASFGAATQTLAEISSSGAVDSVRKFADTTINSNVVSSAYVYWVELEFFGGFYQALAIRLVYNTTC